MISEILQEFWVSILPHSVQFNSHLCFLTFQVYVLYIYSVYLTQCLFSGQGLKLALCNGLSKLSAVLFHLKMEADVASDRIF
jgi:hypothetical protein